MSQSAATTANNSRTAGNEIDEGWIRAISAYEFTALLSQIAFSQGSLDVRGFQEDNC